MVRNSLLMLKSIGCSHCGMQEVWKISTTTGAKRGKKASLVSDMSAFSSQTMKESEGTSKSSALAPGSIQAPVPADSVQVSVLDLFLYVFFGVYESNIVTGCSCKFYVLGHPCCLFWIIFI